MRTRRPKHPPVPRRFLRYVPADWPDCGAWIREREAWNAAHLDPVTGTGPLGDDVSLLRSRREARLLDWHEAAS